MSQLPILYSFRRCPYAMRGRMGLYYAGITCELREVDLKNKPAHMLEISPKGTVPVLLLPDGTVIEESLDVLNWSLEQNDPMGWKLSEDEDRAGADKLISTTDTSFKKALDRYKYPNRYEGEDPIENRQKAEAFLKDLDRRLANHQFLFADRITRADIAIFPFIRQFSKTDLEWFQALPYENLKRWLNTLLESDIFNAVMEKYPAWTEENETVLFAAKAA